MVDVNMYFLRSIKNVLHFTLSWYKFYTKSATLFYESEVLLLLRWKWQ